MNLIPTKGFRAVYTMAEVCEFLGMTPRQVEYRIEAGQLKRSNSGKFGFAQKDVNQFLVKLNNGKAS